MTNFSGSLLLSVTMMLCLVLLTLSVRFSESFLLFPQQSPPLQHRQQSFSGVFTTVVVDDSATRSSSSLLRFKNSNDNDLETGSNAVNSSSTARKAVAIATAPADTLATGTSVDLKWSDFYTAPDDQAAAPVIFLHGLLGSKRNFATIGKALATQLNKKRRILALDLRNHGENHHDWRDEMGYEEMASDVIAFMDNNKIKKAVIVGHSMGGKVAQTLALLHSKRIEGLVVIDIAPVTYTADTAPQWKYVTEIIDILNSTPIGETTTRDDIDTYLRKKIPDPAIRSFCMTNLDLRKGCWKINLKGITKEMESIAGFLESHQPEQYPGDVFFINGGQSRFVKHAHMDTIAKYFPNHMLTTIRGVGHWVHAEAPDDTIALLKRYLDR